MTRQLLPRQPVRRRGAPERLRPGAGELRGSWPHMGGPGSGRRLRPSGNCRCHSPTPSSRPIAVLSFCCGIGTTFLAVRDLGVSPVLSWCWELDEECKRVTSGHSPRVRHWGDALASDPQWTAQLLQAHGPTDTLVLVCAGPPCTDFSQMRSQQPGLSGSEGCKFKEWVKWFQTFRSALQNQHILLLENVIPSASLHAELDRLVLTKSFVVDAASWGVVSRPRL